MPTSFAPLPERGKRTARRKRERKRVPLSLCGGSFLWFTAMATLCLARDLASDYIRVSECFLASRISASVSVKQTVMKNTFQTARKYSDFINLIVCTVPYFRCGSGDGSWFAGPTSFSSARSEIPASAGSSTWRGPTRSTPTPPQTPPPRPPITRKSCRRCVTSVLLL